jgi:plastocyanin
MNALIRKLLVGLCVTGLTFAAAAVRWTRFARAAETAPATVSVTIDNFSFTPREITVDKGTTVTWTNHDDVPHTVVSPDKAFRSKALDTDEQFSFAFNDAGTFGYFCSVHPMMTGKVTVK